MNDPVDQQQRHETLLLAEEVQLNDIKQPHSNDVLCGRGVTTNKFPGNCSFRALVGLNKELYVSSTKRQKMAISRSIVQAVRSLNPPGRFLDKDQETGLWNDIGHKKAVEKTSQALRDGAATLRKQLSADLGDPDFLDAVFRDDDGDVTMKGTEKEDMGVIDVKDGTEGKDEKEGSNKDDEEEDEDKNDDIDSGTNHHSENKDKVKGSEKAKGNNKTVPAKKSHRRVKSNPSSLAQVVAANKAQRRLKAQQQLLRQHPHGELNEPPPSPGYHFHHHHHHMYPPQSPAPPTPHPPPSARSLPNSPMSWGGAPPPRYGSLSPGPAGLFRRYGPPPPPHHSPYHQPSPLTFSPYGKPSNHDRTGRSRSFDHPPTSPASIGPPPPHGNPRPSLRHHSWSPYGHHPHRYHHPPYPPPHYGPPPPPGHPGHHHHLLPPSSPGHVASSPGHDRSPSPTSPAGVASSSSAAVTPGGHHHLKFPPPPGYYGASKSPHHHQHGTPEWSPRRVNHHPYGHHSSPHRHSYSSAGASPARPRHASDYTPERSAGWSHGRPHSPLAYYHHLPSYHPEHPQDGHPAKDGDNHQHGGDDDDDAAASLAVPALGGERSSRKDDEPESPRLHLAPRARPVPNDKMPPRLTPLGIGNLGSNTSGRREFMPPRISPRYQRSPTSEEGSIRSSFHCSPVEEEKKTADVEEKETTIMPSYTSSTSLTSTMTSLPDRNTSPDKDGRDSKGSFKLDLAARPDTTGSDAVGGTNKKNPTESAQEREEGQDAVKKEDTLEARASPGLLIAMGDDGEGIEAVMSHHDMDMKVGYMNVDDDDDDDDGCRSQYSHNEVQCVDDIAMSPLPFDQEDPTTLMDLPEDIMTLPISPCGPHDEQGE